MLLIKNFFLLILHNPLQMTAKHLLLEKEGDFSIRKIRK